MKKIFAILAVIATFALVGCSKSKDGDCSGLNATTTTTVAGQTITQTIKCD